MENRKGYESTKEFQTFMTQFTPFVTGKDIIFVTGGKIFT